MSQIINKIANDTNHNCEFCGDNSAELETKFNLNKDIILSSYYCFQCFFGVNRHIQSYPVIHSIFNGTIRCNDCDSLGKNKLYFINLEKTLYLCDSHLAPSAPMISRE